MNTSKKSDEEETARQFHFSLFIHDNELNSKQAQRNLEHLCQTYLANRYHIEIIDVSQNVQQALAHGVLVTPLLKIQSSQAQYTLVGNLRDTHKVLILLGFNEEDLCQPQT